MRPLSLQLKGFTAFRDEQTIDFRDLDLFVLTGPTGSGKSSLLDAITYALFGWVERVGNQTSQLVSQGQPAMSVMLDFEVGGRSYRVTRRTPANGSGGKALLERLEGSDWVSFGEGADSIRGVNSSIRELIGLDYDAFTRSVILPQGKFAEFLTGKKEDRRQILTELLGLELFGRMAQRAGEISRNAKVGYTTKQEVVEREYAGVTDNSVADATALLKSLRSRLQQAEALEERLGDIAKRWAATRTEIAALRKCATQAGGHAETFLSGADELESISAELDSAEAGGREAATLVETARGALESARKNAEHRSAEVGDPALLHRLMVKAEGLDAVRAELEAATNESNQATLRSKSARDELEEAAKEITIATTAREDAEEKVAVARAAHDTAHRHDLVAALTAGMTAGDPCPVCETPLKNVPAAEHDELERTTAALQAAEKALTEATAAVAAAEKTHAVATQKVATQEADGARVKAEIARLGSAIGQIEEELAGVLGSKVKDPIAAIDGRLKQLEEVTAAVVAHEGKLKEAEDEAARRSLAVERKQRDFEKIGVRLAAVGVAELFERITDITSDLELPSVPSIDPAATPAALSDAVATVAKDLARTADDLSAAVEQRHRRLQELQAEAAASLPPDSDMPTDDLSAVVAGARSAVRELTSEVTRADERAKSLTERNTARARLEEEIEADREESALYSDLAKELKNDRIVSFLQAEALRTLAAAAGLHLRELSRGRYDLHYEDDRFYVIDSWNGRERRDVKTLSGGETFLASLALALSLSEHVQHLAVTERDRLDSLFLDEGFGTLDPEALEAVVEGIEQLGRDGRLVGVITHVEELAERLPVRLRVVKSPRGSTVESEVATPPA